MMSDYKYPLLLTILLLVAELTTYAQQDATISQYNLNQSMINPAYCGLYNRFMANTNIRKQWNGLTGNPNTNLLTVNSSIIPDMLGGGLLIKQDKIGVINSTEVNMMLAYNIELNNNNSVSFGLQGGLTSINYDQGELNLRVLDDPDFPPVTFNSSKPSFGAGMALMSDHYYLGISIPRLINTEFEDGLTNNTIYKRHYYLSAAIIRDIANLIKIKPGIQLKYVEGAPLSFDLGANVMWNNKFWFGAYTRKFTTQGLLVQFLMNDVYRLGYTLEIPTNKHIEARFLTHELVVGIDLALFGSQDVFLRYF